MNKILLVIQREYLSRVKKKSFIVMTILGPLLMAALFIVPAFLATMSDGVKKVKVLDETGWFQNKFEDSERFDFEYIYTDLETAKSNLTKEEAYALLYIPKPEVSVPSSAMIFSEKQVTIDLKGYIRSIMAKEVENQKLGAEIVKEIQKANPAYDQSLPEKIGRAHV